MKGKKIPQHVAVIMDGNGRWAKQRGLPRVAGHRKGAESVRAIVETAGHMGIKYVTLYAFSTENWKRPKTEVNALMGLLEEFLKKETQRMMKNNIRLQAIGRLSDLPPSVQRELHLAIQATAKNTGITLIFALSYSGRAEIIDAVKSLIREVREGLIDPAQIDEVVLSQHLYTRYYPDPDLLIRTSGEMRLSNFLLWQLSYTEIYVTQTLFPDFGEKEFKLAIDDYEKRQRRFGGVSE
ncbi:isoprenyl transferase [Kamptonema cortianum]|uniref:Isoprenyl transferase n=1 Tax=Geitlerinema calcuttense NRMC-F 0142 TaxID=2922238 RepID=A0ABT7M0U7_9CYAN|nr:MULTISPECIES: isoprenyl transferase [Cyanophyceae]MDK3161811.1 isoprenyl transferase [Kamptonema cortianum]MDL5054382.1 isoprenyl transferase [Oscillatoria laete-virens NRMC-F 0139]MDL5057894.1 isoprenyl transferase [Geitlerinema calcuttense NRMC-F 0142]